MFTKENTDGYTKIGLELLNQELDERLAGIEPGTDEYHTIEKNFADEVSHR